MPPFWLPGYFRVELGIAKFIGALFLLYPKIPARLKEWVYAGFVITMISGCIAHLPYSDSLRSALSAVVALQILMASYFTYHKLQARKKQCEFSNHSL